MSRAEQQRRRNQDRVAKQNAVYEEQNGGNGSRIRTRGRTALPA